jgi:hypothetical protein
MSADFGRPGRIRIESLRLDPGSAGGGVVPEAIYRQCTIEGGFCKTRRQCQRMLGGASRASDVVVSHIIGLAAREIRDRKVIPSRCLTRVRAATSLECLYGPVEITTQEMRNS